MTSFFIDLTLLAIFIIGLTAFLGVLTHGLAAKLFGGSSFLKFSTRSTETQAGWQKVQRRR
jgi:chemotaxis receptor (MCP) glutamine deamidase CheD